MPKLTKSLFVISSLFLLAQPSFANQKRTVYTTDIDGKEYILQTNTFAFSEHRKTLQLLEQAMAENNQITDKYLKTNSPAWKNLMTDELKANNAKFRDIWKRIVVERHYNKDVLDAYEKHKAAQLANRNKMYAHFFSLSTNEPFKEKVKTTQKVDQNHFLNDKATIKRLRTYL